jgi:formamidopyrimidine-DNA glycosylase
MPELPEVETTVRGIRPYLAEQRLLAIDVRDRRLRWPVPEAVQLACGQIVKNVSRRAKYILIELETGLLMIHLGMSGSLRVLSEPAVPGKHDHFDIVLQHQVIRFNDPRRFGAFLWCEHPAAAHPLLAPLGPEPLSGAFDAEYLYQRSRGRKVAIKNFIMNGQVVVGPVTPAWWKPSGMFCNAPSARAERRYGISPTRMVHRVTLRRNCWSMTGRERLVSSAVRRCGRK